MISWIWDRATLRDPVPPPCWFSWIVLGLWPAIIIVGLITQCAITGRGIYHTECNFILVLFKWKRKWGQINLFVKWLIFY